MVHIVLPSISYYGADVTRLRFTPVTLGSAPLGRRGLVERKVTKVSAARRRARDRSGVTAPAIYVIA